MKYRNVQDKGFIRIEPVIKKKNSIQKDKPKIREKDLFNFK